MWRVIAREILLHMYNRILLGRKSQYTTRFIKIRLLDENQYFEPCAFLPQDGIKDFWDALGVSEDSEEKLQPEWMKGNLIAVAPEFPVLSELIQMQIDNSNIKLPDIPELLREIAIGRKRCNKASGIAVFNALEKAATQALAEGKGISLSPFG